MIEKILKGHHIMKIQKVMKPAVLTLFGGLLAPSAASATTTYDDSMSKYNNDLEQYNKDKAAYDKKFQEYNQKKRDYEQAKKQYEEDLKTYQAEIEAHKKKLREYEENIKKQEADRTEYERKLAEYKKLKAEWDLKKRTYDNNKTLYDTAIANYNKAVADYKKAIEDRIKTIERNKQLDAEENKKRKEAYEAALKQQEIDARKPGRFSSDVKNALAFTHEPNANVNIDIGKGGALALVKMTDGDWKFNWNTFNHDLSSDKLDEATLKKHKLDTRVLKHWDPNITYQEFIGGGKYADAHVVLAKKNTPFKVMYTNIQNSTYDGRKISKIEYIYEVLETGSDSDLMQVSIAKDPTISVWIRGANGSTNHKTRVTPIFYDNNGKKIIPTKEKPIFLGMGSMNAGYRTLDERDGWFFDGKDLFSELMGFPYDRDLYMQNKFYEKYKVKWTDRNKDGFFAKVKSEWDTVSKQYWNNWDNVTAPFKEKLKTYMKTKFGNDESLWPSQYREIVYKLNNGTFIKLNDSRVSSHPDGYYSDTNVDRVFDWDNPTSPTQYIGAGVIHVTSDNFSMEFGATTSRNQRFALNTIVADFYIAAKPVLELQNTPEPPLPKEPVRPNVVSPHDPGQEPTPPTYNPRDIPKPNYTGPKEPTPPAPFTLTPPIPPKPVTPPTGAVPNNPPKVEIPEWNGGVPPIDPPVVEIPEWNGGVPPLDPPTVDIPEYNEPIGKVPNDPPVVEIPEFEGGVPPIDPPTVDIPEFKGGVPPIDPPTVEIPEFEGGVPPIDPPVVEIPEFEGGVPPIDPPVVEIPRITPPDPIDSEPPKPETKTGIPEVREKPILRITFYKDPKGHDIIPPEDGERVPKKITGYIYTSTKKDKDGNTIHVYTRVKTYFKDTHGKQLLPPEDGENPKKNILGYIYLRTEKDKDRNTTHIYTKVKTYFKDPKGRDIIPPEDGENPKKNIAGYIYVTTKKDKDGNIIHVYERVKTYFKDPKGRDIIPPEEGENPKKNIPGYIYLRTEKDKDGNIIHIYQKVKTYFKDTDGKELLPSEDGENPKKDIPGYIYLRTEKDKDGNIIHVYKKAPKKLPETGDPLTGAPLGAALFILGRKLKRKKNH